MSEPPVVLFDGHCNLCNGTLNFVLDRERDHELRFAALQSDAGREALVRAAGEPRARELLGDGAPGSIVVIADDRVYTQSDAALRVLHHLRAPWRWGRLLLVVPRPLRDVVYRFIARNRYRWFGRSEVCRVPTPELRARFLS